MLTDSEGAVHLGSSLSGGQSCAFHHLHLQLTNCHLVVVDKHLEGGREGGSEGGIEGGRGEGGRE